MKKRGWIVVSIFILALTYCFGQEPSSETYNIDYNNIQMPESPSSASFSKYGNTSVNTATGVPSISIPLYTLEADGVSVPISLTYNASGVKVNELASSVGLNWSLNAGGGVSRSVRVKADDVEGWLSPSFTALSDSFYNTFDENSYSDQQSMMGSAPDYKNGNARNRDHNPDLFTYSFLNFSGGFIFDKNGNLLKQKQDNIDLDFYNVNIDQATDQKGNTYSFGFPETSHNKNLYGSQVQGGLPTVDTDDYSWPVIEIGWKLAEIETKNGDLVKFDYNPVSTVYELSDVNTHISLTNPCETNPPPNSTKPKWNKTTTQYDYTNQLVKEITHEKNGEVITRITFDYLTDSSLSHWKTKLNKITIENLISGRSKGFRFVYGKFNGDPRLKLKEVYEFGNTISEEKPPYTFEYFYEYQNLPAKNSFSQDFFGYFNNKSNNGLVHRSGIIEQVFSQEQTFINNNTGDRHPNENALKRGTLKKITYPTGGRTEFEYELNSVPDASIPVDKYCGGLRVREIKDIDETGTYNRKTYSYEGLNGFNMDSHFSLTSKIEGNSESFYSSFVTPQGPYFNQYKSGYFYNKVTVVTYNGLNQYKEIYEYVENPESYLSYDYGLKSQSIYKGMSNQPLKIKEIKREIIGTPREISWNILGEMICYGNVNSRKLGYSHDEYIDVAYYQGDYALLPTQIATTEFLKSGSIYKPVTTVQYIEYDEQTLLKTQEITDYRRTRNAYDNYPIEDTDGERTTVDYTYPWSPGINLNLPASLPVKIEVFSLQNNNNKLSGQDFEYDSTGNIKTTFKYNKGQGSNNSPLSYVDSNYEQETSFKFKEGKPTQVLSKDGIPTSYIWGYNHQYPVAKIEGKFRSSLPSSLVTNIETTTNESTLQNLLEQLREYPTLDDAMVTTYTHLPLAGVYTITDPKGDKITYHYDAFGRLKYVTDKQNKRLTENEYNYGQ